MKTKIGLLQLKDKLDMMSQEYRDAHIELTDLYLEEYTALKYKQELEFKQFKDQYKSEIKDLIQEIRENGISKRNIEDHRVIYEKNETTADNLNYVKLETNPTILAENIFCELLQNVKQNNSKSRFAYECRYIDAKDVIIKYYQRYFEIKNEIDEFKQKQSIEIKILTEEIKNEGIPLYI